MIRKKNILVFILILILLGESSVNAQNFSNPLRFYGKDVLTYMQVLYNQQDYDKMLKFMAGPMVDTNPKYRLIKMIEESNFSYEFKRAGIKEISTPEWTLSYKKTINATNHNLKLRCILFRDTCMLWLDEKSFKEIFIKK